MTPPASQDRAHPTVWNDRPAARLAGLDGLRAIAVAMVIAYHFMPAILPGGFVGVDIFFVISGFLITALLLSRRPGGTKGLRSFWLRRARRLLPALVVLVLACCTAALVTGGDLLVGLGSQVLGAITFSSNWVFIAQDQSYFAQDAPQLFRNLWSLAVEEQFYLLWPFVVLALVLLRSPAVRAVIALGIAAASAVTMAVLYTPGLDPSRVYYGSDAHCFGLALGAALAFALQQRRPLDLDAGESGFARFERRWAALLGTLALAALVVCSVLMTSTTPFTYRGGLPLVAVLTAVLIWSATRPGATLGRALDAAPLRATGERSYGLYLWHWPALLLVQAALPAAARTGVDALASAGIALAITIGAALLSHRFVETPIRRGGFGVLFMPLWPAGRRGGRLVAASAAVALVLAGGVATSAAVAQGARVTDAEHQVALGERTIQSARQHPAPQVDPDASPSSSPSLAASPTPRVSATARPSGVHPAATAPPVMPGGDILAIGDSVMLAAAPALQAQFPGIRIDAVVSRQPREAPRLLAGYAARAELRPIVVIGLGTNGYLGTGTLDAIRSAAGPSTRLVFVNIYADRQWLGEVNGDLAGFVKTDPRSALVDWHRAIAPHLDLLASDHIHPGGRGARLYAACLARVIDARSR
ncbi:MAG TPA: acyltransferase family protein [Humibacter sp.]|nr:acyltransferase family protein [Humibacter sp.]